MTESKQPRKIIAEYLYLDLQTCDRCLGTDAVLDEVMATLTPAFQLAGISVEYNKIEMETPETAARYQFLSSPTIRVNGRDIFSAVHENSCGCCSEISETDVACRVFKHKGETYEVPPKEMLARGILQASFGAPASACCTREYVLPQNLKDFYKGKMNRNRKPKGEV